MYLVIILALALAVYRVTRFWIKDTIIQNQRIWILNALLYRKKAGGKVRQKLHELLECHYCVSAHVAWIGVVIAMQFTSIPMPVLVWLAAWGLEPLLWRWSEDPITMTMQVPGVVRHRNDQYGT